MATYFLWSGAGGATAGAMSSADLDATGGSGTFSATATSPATASLAATGSSGTFSGSALLLGTAFLAATGGSGSLSLSAEGVAPSGIGNAIFVRPRRRYVIEHRGRLMVFDTEQQAKEAQDRITAAKQAADKAIAAASTSSKARRVKAKAADQAMQVLQSLAPVEVVPLADVRALAQAGQQQLLNEAIKLRDMEAVYRLWQDMREDEEDIAALLEFL